MRVDTGRISVEVPEPFEDRTSYVFEEPHDAEKGAPPDRLSVAFEPMPEGVPAAALVERFCRTVRDTDRSAAITEASRKAGPAEAATVEVRFAGGSTALMVAAFRWPGALVAKVQYESSRPEAWRVFEHVLASVRSIGVRRTPAPGFVRRRAGRLWLEMPARHAAPSSFQLEAEDGRARLFVSNEDRPLADEYPLADWVDHSMTDIFEIEPLDGGSCRIDQRMIEERAHRLDRFAEEGELLGSTFVHLAWASLAEDAGASLWLVEAGEPTLGDALWPEIVASVRPAQEAS